MSPMNNDELYEQMQRDFKRIDEQFKESRIAYETLRRDFATSFVSRDIMKLQIDNLQLQIATLVEQLQQLSKVFNERWQHIEKTLNEKISSITTSKDKEEQQNMSSKNMTLFAIGLVISGISGFGGLTVALIELFSHSFR